MTDRELLELAAKAAGFGAPDTGGTCWTESEYPRGSGQHGALWNCVGHMDTMQLWNPLTEDGDALRLAFKLRLNIIFNGGFYVVSTELSPDVCCMGGLDSLRYSIVLAAAEIGRGMP